MSIPKKLESISSTRLIAFSFLVIILVGATLLMFPFSSRSGEWTNPLTALFTATSATCVTGLAIYDTYMYWSVIGQVIILLLIQIGGLGLMTIISLFAIFTRKRIGLHERKLLMASSGNMRISGIIQLIKKVATITFTCEAAGAICLCFTFIPKMGAVRGIYNAIFHSVSAFCNAGFDLMGRYEPGSSLAHFEQNAAVIFPICVLIIVGGIGFQVWMDIIENKHHIKRYTLHTKVALLTTLVLVVGGSVLYFIFEYGGHLKVLSLPHKWLSSFLMSVTTRTAGFAGFDLTQLSASGSVLTMTLMLIGGCPGSTAGGMKTTTIAVMICSVIGMSKGNSDITIFKRRLNKDLIKHAAVIVFVYISAVLVATMTICALEPVGIQSVLFETSSALGTAGLSQGLSATAGVVTQLILIVLMYGGRIGGLSLLLVFAEKKSEAKLKRPAERLMIG